VPHAHSDGSTASLKPLSTSLKITIRDFEEAKLRAKEKAKDVKDITRGLKKAKKSDPKAKVALTALGNRLKVAKAVHKRLSAKVAALRAAVQKAHDETHKALAHVKKKYLTKKAHKKQAVARKTKAKSALQKKLAQTKKALKKVGDKVKEAGNAFTGLFKKKGFADSEMSAGAEADAYAESGAEIEAETQSGADTEAEADSEAGAEVQAEAGAEASASASAIAAADAAAAAAAEAAADAAAQADMAVCEAALAEAAAALGDHSGEGEDLDASGEDEGQEEAGGSAEDAAVVEEDEKANAPTPSLRGGGLRAAGAEDVEEEGEA